MGPVVSLVAPRGYGLDSSEAGGRSLIAREILSDYSTGRACHFTGNGNSLNAARDHLERVTSEFWRFTNEAEQLAAIDSAHHAINARLTGERRYRRAA